MRSPWPGSARATGAVTWSIAAHTGSTASGTGKIIKGDFGDDGTPGTGDSGEGDGMVDTGPNAFIGRIVRYAEVFAGATTGPSISSPAMDTYGNLYFLATVSLKKPAGPKLTTALLRANFSDATSAFELEELAEIGDVIAGQNSALNYQIQFLSTADADSTDSGSIWAGNIVQDLSPAVNPAGITYGSPLTLGALVIRCRIVYDRNGDGLFSDPTAAGNAGSPDQAFNVALVIMPGDAHNPADFNGDGVVNPDDLSDYINCFFNEPPCPGADFNGDGLVNPDDLSDFINAFFG